jgi:hypothetical protein
MADSTTVVERAGEAMMSLLPDRPRIGLRRAVRDRVERHRLKSADLTVIAHPKSGSTWLRFQLARVYQLKFGLPETVIPRIERYHRLNPAIPRLHMAGYQYIARLIARPAPDKELEHKSAIFLLRHPLDVIVSLYFHIQKHAVRERKLFNDWPLDLSGVPMLDFALNSHWGLRETIRFYNGCASHAATMPRAHIVRYEDMRHHPARELSAILQFAGAEATIDDAAEAAAFTSFERLQAAELHNAFDSARLRPGDPNDPESFKVRRAKVFGYRDYFSPAECGELEAIIDNELDPKLGYSHDLGKQTAAGRS